MKSDKIRAHCARCHHQQLFVQAKINHPLHLTVAVLTGGLWLVSWVALCIGKAIRPWRCEHCGWHEPEVAPGDDPKSSRPAQITRRSSPEGHALVGAKTSESQH